MTVSNTTSRNQYTATSGQTVFPYTFEIFDKNDVAVLKNGTLLSEGTDYTVSGVGNDSGGNITLTVGATASDIITIYRDMPLNRETDYQNSGDFLAQEVNDDFDRLWLAAQQVATNNLQAIRKPDSDLDSIVTELPTAANRANKFLSFDGFGNVITLTGTSGSATDAANVTFTQTGSGAQATTVKEKLNEIVSVEDFGAVGNGTVNDTDAIQAAIDSGAKKIYLGDSGKTYLVKTTDDGLVTTDAACLTISSNDVTFFGEATLKRDEDIHAHIILVTGDNVTIKGIKINGNRSNNDLTGSDVHVADSIKIKNADYCKVYNCEVYDNIGKGINGTGVTYSEIMFNTIKNSGRSAIQVASESTVACSYNKIHFNQINGTDDGEFANGIFLSQSSGSTAKNLTGYYNSIIGNVVLNAGDWGIESGYRCFYTIIANNIVEKSYAVAVGCRDNKGTIITGNNVECNIAGSSGQMIGVLVDSYQMGTGDAYAVVDSRCTVTGNSIRAFSTNGINIKNSKYCNVSSNNIVGRNSSTGVGINSTTSFLRCSDNFVSNCQTGLRISVADLAAADSVSFCGNSIETVSEGLKLEAVDINDSSFIDNTFQSVTTPLIDNGATIFNTRMNSVFDLDNPYKWASAFNAMILSDDGFERDVPGSQFGTSTIFGVAKPMMFKVRIGTEFGAVFLVSGTSASPTITAINESTSIGDSGSAKDFRVEISGSNVVFKRYAAATAFTTYIVEIF
jgi:hypothetical protein